VTARDRYDPPTRFGARDAEQRMSDVRAVSDGIAQQIQEFFRQTIDPLRERLMFTQRPSDGSLRGDSMVLFVGNHSSGKSTFINHLLGADIQETGMAPTHDDFTILRYSDEAREISASKNSRRSARRSNGGSSCVPDRFRSCAR